MKKYNSLLLTSLFLIFALAISSCSKDDSKPFRIPTTALQMVNAYTYSPAIVFTQNNDFITPYGAALKYNEYMPNPRFLSPGNKRIRVYGNGDLLVSDTTVNLLDSAYYTSFVYGNTATAKNLITKNVSINDLGSKVAVRFLHLASNQGSVNVYLNDLNTLIYQNRTQEIAVGNSEGPNTVYIPQTAGKHKIIITDNSSNTLVEREFDLTQSNYYSILLTGDKNDTSKPLYLGVTQQ